MKICFLSTSNSIHSYKWVCYFANIGWEVIWLSTSENKFQSVKGLTFYKLRTPFVLSLLDARRIIKATDPLIVHAHYVGKYGLLGSLSGLKPLIITAWGSDIIFGGKHFFKRPLIKYILHKSKLITCDANHMKNAMIKLGVNAEKIKIILFGVDTKKFFPKKNKSNDLQKLTNNFLVLSVRNFEPVYNVKSLIFAANLVLSKYPDTEFLLAGKGSLKPQLQALVKKLKLQKNIRFSGHISSENMPELYNSADICVSTSLSDAGIAGSTAEAMACGVPVIATETGENNLWIENDINGFLVPPDNFEKLAERIITLIESPANRKQFGINNVAKIHNNNSYQTEMKKMRVIYEKI